MLNYSPGGVMSPAINLVDGQARNRIRSTQFAPTRALKVLRMQRFSIRRRLGQHWMYVVAVMVVVVAGFAVYRLQGIFASPASPRPRVAR